MKRLVMLAFWSLAVAGLAQTPAISVKNLMTAGEFEAAGLHKLTKEEIQALDTWLVKALVGVAQRSTGSVSTGSLAVPGSYAVEASVNDEKFIIDGEIFKARTYCFNVNKGDRVKFVEGSASGACVSAKFLNLRTGNTCEVWCE